MKIQLLSSSSLQDSYASLVTTLLLSTIVNYERLFITGQSTDPIITVRIEGDAAPPTVGSMYSLTCIVTGAAERLTIAYQWLKDGEMVTEETSETLSFTFLTLSDAGSYTCQATVTSNLLSAPINSTSTTFILTDFVMLMTTTVSNPVMTETVSPPPMDNVRLSFRGSPITNNSIVRVTDIGDNMDSRILCLTSNPDCCAMSDNRMGFWYFPSGREVLSRSCGEDIYRTRTKLATIMLGRRDKRPNAARGPTGLYRCVIPDRHGINQTLIVGAYSSIENRAKIAPLIQLTSISPHNLTNITFSLTCISSGGPVQSVEWMRDGFPLDNTGPLVLINASTASYSNTLDVSGRLQGTYTCQIRGSDNQILSSMDIDINGSAAGPLNVQATRSSSSAPVEVSWSPDQTANITGYRLFYGNGQSILVPSYVTRVVFNFVESQDEVRQFVSVRSESMHHLPSELINATVTYDGVSTAVSATCFSEITLSIAVVIAILATSIVTAIVITVFMGLCYLRKKKLSNNPAVSANVAYGLVNVEPGTRGEGEYVTPDLLAIQSSGSQEPRYEGRVGHESVVYDLPVSQSSSPQPGVYAVPQCHETTQMNDQSLDNAYYIAT